jgi:hypothetical protein
MGNEIKWEADIDVALAQARSENRPVLLDFYNPG